MADTREKFATLTVVLHWAIGLTIIGLIAVGIYMVDLPRGAFKAWLYGWHKVIGTTVLMLAAARILWRWRNGLPKPAGAHPAWQHRLATVTQVVLLIATVALPVSGALFSYGAGHPVPVLGLFDIGPPAEKIAWLGEAARFVHGWAGWSLAAIIALHAAGAIKHHFLDRDGTLKRMLGARIGTQRSAARSA